MIKAIIFDCFGVLAGSGFKEIYRQAGGDLEADGTFLDDVLATANSGQMSSHDMHSHVANRLGMPKNIWYETVQRGEMPNQELLKYIKTLKLKYKTAILSNANTGTLQRKFNPSQLALFDALIVSAEVGMMKPNAEIYELVARKLGVKNSECVFTDDSQAYCEAAQAIGMQAICYKDFEQFRTELEQILSHA